MFKVSGQFQLSCFCIDYLFFHLNTVCNLRFRRIFHVPLSSLFLYHAIVRHAYVVLIMLAAVLYMA